MIYNFNLGIGWASSGVEYAQAYRANILRRIGKEARFIFTDMFPKDNIEHMTRNIGFEDSEIIWLYTFFTDFKIAPVSYTLEQFERTFADRKYQFSRNGNVAKYVFEGDGNFYTAYMVDEKKDLVHRVEMVEHGCLIRKDYFTYGRVYSEYYAPLDGKAHLYQRRFFNEDGSVAYDEITDHDVVMYQFPDQLLCSKEELVGYLVRRLKLTASDVVLIDRTTGIGQTILQNVGPARVGIIIHADHYSEGGTDAQNILWNNYYEYAFSQHRHIDFYVTATDAQNQLLRSQFASYTGVTPQVITIPVGSVDALKYPSEKREKHTLITASRLAGEKHIDWLVDAVVAAREAVPDLTLDIYGKGAEEEALRKQITEKQATGFIHLMGQHNLDEVYQRYDAYLSGSTSEGFGLTLLEAVAAGLPIIGFDVRYGNQTFIDHEANGYLIPVDDHMDNKERVQKLTACIIRLFTEADIEAFHQHSYEKAQAYLTTEVEKRWKEALEPATSCCS
jgi:accessory Sec system glycosylation protein GtfA